MENLRPKIAQALLVVFGIVLLARFTLVLLGPVLPSLLALLSLALIFMLLFRRK